MTRPAINGAVLVLAGAMLLLTCYSVSLLRCTIRQAAHQQGLYLQVSAQLTSEVQDSLDVLARRVETLTKRQVAVVSTPVPSTQPAPAAPSAPHVVVASEDGPRGLYLGDGKVFCQARPLGLPMMLEAADKGLTVHICRGLGWEPDTTQFFRRLVRPGDHVLDVGTNVGYYTLLFALLSGHSGRVKGVEANSRTYELASTTVELNGLSGRVQMLHHAAYDSDGQVVQISASRERPLNNRLVMGSAPPATAGSAPATVPVRTITIDTVVADWQRLDLVKIDVEGAEAGAYAGMQRTITRFPNVVIIMEVNTVRMGVDKAKVFYDKLASDWPSLRKLVGANAVPTTVTELLANRHGDDMVVLSRRTDLG